MPPRATVSVTVSRDRAPSGLPEDPPPDLAARYQQYVERKVATDRAVREISDRLLARVASGELDPRNLDRGLNRFLQIGGPDYAARIIELTLTFLTDIVQDGSRSIHELVDEVAPGIVERPMSSPPQFDPRDWTTCLRQLSEYAERERAAQAAMLKEVVERIAVGELDPAVVDGATAARAGGPVPDRIVRLADLFLGMLTGLDEAGAEFGIGYLRSVERHSRRPDAIEVAGHRGETLEVRFVVSNDEPEPTAVHCTITDLRREDGIGPAFDATVSITPDGFDLEPGTSTTVACAIELSDAFVPEATYVGELDVVTGAETVLEIPLRVRVTGEVPDR